MIKKNYAHSMPGKPEDEWQLLEEHLKAVAELAQSFASKFNSSDWAYLAGLWHDLGKCSAEFQKMLVDANAPESAQKQHRRQVDHSTAGARHAAERLPGAGKLLAYIIAGHHGGLPDGRNHHNSDLESRLDPQRKIPPIQAACAESQPHKKLLLPFQQKCGGIGFQISFFIRMLFSCVVDADFLDTENFLAPDKTIHRKGPQSLGEFESLLFKKLSGFKPDTDINQKRAAILQHCISRATDQPGLFTLTVPTGGGKTLSSLAFALRHALEFQKDRIIYVIPFTSIIEQNAAIFRTILGEDAVLEHHSNYTPGRTEEGDEEVGNSIKEKRHRLACENWDAPLIVTTNVQFFDSLFANRPSKCRKLHNIANSVVILDEAQMLPEPYLRPCLETIRELTSSYSCTAVLCTATQPALVKTDSFPHGLPQESIREIMPDPQKLHADFKRVQLRTAGRITNDELLNRISENTRILCIVNTRQRAADLYKTIRGLPGAYHLSARMCPAHRSQVLAKIRSSLDKNLETRVISTQLVEAGVDLDFPVVYREMAGLDAIVQAAGRCNRNAKMGSGEVVVFLPEDGNIPKIFRRAADAAESILRRFGDDPFSPDAMNDYFQNVYWIAGEELDQKRVLANLENGVRNADFPFKQIAEQFRLIESDMIPVIIPWDDTAERLIEKLTFTEFPRPVLRQLQRYTLQIYPQEMANLKQHGAIRMIQDRYPALSSLVPFYQLNKGLSIEEADLPPEDFFI